MEIKRGEVYLADLDPIVGSEQGGVRPVVVIQNDIGNKFSTTTIAAITTKDKHSGMPTHIHLDGTNEPLRDSVVLLEQIRTIDKQRLKERMGHLAESKMSDVNKALFVSFGLVDETNSVEENYSNVFSNAYPNPARDVVSFDYNMPFNAQSASVAIYNMMGQEVK